MPQVSIIMPVYNGGEYLQQAINSVLVQAFSDWELIVVNDGSTDATARIIELNRQRDNRIRVVAHESNLGLVASLNEAVAVSKAEILARLDCDDFWSDPQKLRKQLEYLEKHPACVLLGTWAAIVREDAGAIRKFKLPTTDRKIRKQLLWHNCFVHSSIVAKKSALLGAGGYRAEERHVEDYGLWLRMGKIGELANLGEVMITYRDNSAGITRTKNRQQLEKIMDLVKEHKNSYPNYWLGWLKWHLQKAKASLRSA